MHLLRLLSVASVAILSGAILAACTSANPGWTYAPAPPVTPAPSVVESGAPSASAGSGDAPGGGAVAIAATALAFEQTEVNAPAGEPFQIAFTNNDAGTPHNVAIHKGDAAGAEVFKGEIFSGVDTKTYDVPALDAGAYAFVCTVHPTMVGTLTAE
jgi:plastocyanin